MENEALKCFAVIFGRVPQPMDETLIFHSLNEEELKSIVGIQLGSLQVVG